MDQSQSLINNFDQTFGERKVDLIRMYRSTTWTTKVDPVSIVDLGPKAGHDWQLHTLTDSYTPLEVDPESKLTIFQGLTL